ncbi:TPA: DUF3983 domain-containing protein [Bacillus cereus]|nr:DUF3983 domain-containing protein [Bacillus cereus]MDR5048911.1 DUF3983 domain-containing protein [Bacillus thuringiensis]MDR4438433.1 DUF3983 domain-containing protein [Bacillus cereus]MRC07687.1 DUF3983 domain-containing protein [Bacillus thuringiensis]MRC62631.1 DUF3983 domain-containing protein [Bacillus thuringiensis]
MANLKKGKIRKAIMRRAKAVEKYQVDKVWRGVFVKAGIIMVLVIMIAEVDHRYGFYKGSKKAKSRVGGV